MWAGVFAAGTRIQYCSTIRATEWLTGPIKALVNLRRSELAKYFDLTMPATLDEERDMWSELMNERIQHHPGPADWLGV